MSAIPIHLSLASMAIIDLSHTVRDGLVTYKGLPAPVICDFWNRDESAANYDDGSSFQIGRIDMVANTGTYIDAPFHRYATGRDIAGLPMNSIANLPGSVVHIRTGVQAIGPEYFADIDIAGRAVLVHTGWDQYWGKEQYFEEHPFLTEQAALLLRERKATLVGIDSYNIDNSATRKRPVHSVLLGADIPIVEHMTNLQALPDTGFLFTAAPVKIEGMGSFPVRAFAVTQN